MPSIKKFNWVNRPSRWDYAQAWRSHRTQMAQRFLDEGSATSTAFANALNNLSSGMATLAAQASILRAQSQISAAKDKALASIDKLA